MATKTKAPETTDLALVDEVGAKIVDAIDRAPNVHVASESDPGAAMIQILDRLVSAESLSDLNAVFGGDTRNSRDLALDETHVRLSSMTIRQSDFPDPTSGLRGWYGQYECVDVDTGESFLVSSTSKAVMAAFANADANGWTPVTGYFREGRETDRGFRPIHFEFDEPTDK